MKKIVLCFPDRSEMMTILTAVCFLLKRQGIEELPECVSAGEKLLPLLDKRALGMLICDVTEDGIIPMLEQFRANSAELKLVLVADETVSPVQYIRPSILPTALLWRPVGVEEAKQTLHETLLTLYRQEQRHNQEERVFSLDIRGVVRIFSYDEILFFEARNKRLYLHLKRKEISFPGTLEKLEEELPEQFLRIHKSFIVNRPWILEVHFGQNLLVLDGDIELPISRSYKPRLKAVFT